MRTINRYSILWVAIISVIFSPGTRAQEYSKTTSKPPISLVEVSKTGSGVSQSGEAEKTIVDATASNVVQSASPSSSYGKMLYGYVTFPSDIDLRGPYPGVGSLGGRMPVDSLPWNVLTHLSFFAADCNTDGSWKNSGNNPAYLYKMPYLAEQAHLRGKYAGFCFGGSGDAGIRGAINDPNAHTTLINMLLDLIDNYGQDFIDFDLEGSPLDDAQWTAFAARFNDSLQTRTSHNNPAVPPFIVLTVGISRGLSKLGSKDDVGILNIMSYDNAGSWWGQLNHDCSVTSWENLDGTGQNLDPQNYAGQGGKAFVSMQEGARLLRNAGWSAEKIVMGADFNPTTVTGGSFPDGRGPTVIRKVWNSAPSWSGSGLKFYSQWNGGNNLAAVPDDSIFFDQATHTYWAHTGTSAGTDKMYYQVSWPGRDSSIYFMRQMVDSMNIGGVMIWGLTETYGTSSPAPTGGWAWLGHQFEKYFSGTLPPPPPPPDIPKIKGTLFLDQDQNGSRGASEPPMAGWNVTLAGPKNANLLTDGTGAYSFEALPLGSYTVTLEQKAGWNRTLPSSSYSYSISVDSAGQRTTANFGLYSTTAFGWPVGRFWNIVSLPVTVLDRSVDGVFPLHSTPAFAFTNQYIQKTVLEYGAGYWIKFPFGHTVWQNGGDIQSDTTSVTTGWNFIGSVSTPIHVANLRTEPPGILNPYVYGYETGSYVADTIQPGRGYWVSATQPGQVIVSSVPSTESEEGTISRQSAPYLNRITFSLPSGERTNLYYEFTPSETVGITIHAAPPAPPEKTFRSSYLSPTTGTSAGIVASIGLSATGMADLPIIVQDAGPELTVSWEVLDPKSGVEISGEGGLRQTLAGSGSVDLSFSGTSGGESFSDTRFTLRLFSDGLSGVPESFSLAQNFPNPFNSTTLINFSIPASGRVKIEVFNIVGELIATLADDTMEAGFYSLPFEASPLASGMYFYRLTADGGEAGRFTATKKLLLIR